jgi:hypothetical protein
MRTSSLRWRAIFVSAILVAVLFAGAAGGILGVCGPFTDVTDAGFCPFVLEIFTLGITTGTGPTTYDPTANVTRLQMAAFLSRTVDGALKRGSRRAALDQFWTTQNSTVLGLTTVGSNPNFVKSDGADLWVTNFSSDNISRVRAADGKLLETWTGALSPVGVTVAMGRVVIAGKGSPGNLYLIDPSQPPGAVTVVASTLGIGSSGIAFDGTRFWTGNLIGGSVSIVTPGATIPWTVTTVTTGFGEPNGVVYDGANIWVTDFTANKLLKLDAAGAILQTITVGTSPEYPEFDGSNIWVPGSINKVTVVRASSGAVLATLTGNGLGSPFAAAFDGQRVLISNQGNGSVSLFKAADLTPLGSFPTGAATAPSGACSDGINFWITLQTTSGKLARF